jgi:hypothetical protein
VSEIRGGVNASEVRNEDGVVGVAVPLGEPDEELTVDQLLHLVHHVSSHPQDQIGSISLLTSKQRKIRGRSRRSGGAARRAGRGAHIVGRVDGGRRDKHGPPRISLTLSYNSLIFSQPRIALTVDQLLHLVHHVSLGEPDEEPI